MVEEGVSKKSMGIELTATGRRSAREISRPARVGYEDTSLYLLPVKGSDTDWYKNALNNPVVKISADGQQFNGRSETITDLNRVKEVLNRVLSKYGESDVNNDIIKNLIFVWNSYQSEPLSRSGI